ncbi:DNA repair protein XRCC1 isoform X2 [Protopterus annectens]|uniref:DNA repair protein XRCC1 isoform X2 n=1 Tax=Protopterus annectens TaxID=7888 RepID=UPI001CFAE791|nr:DNA repair protein XRCC1 isoform X2 [Protopterus annectens]
MCCSYIYFVCWTLWQSVILVTSSFMSPSESKNGTNLNRVRMFGPDKLVKATAEKKWDRVKIVCTQPYNKNLVYGLSFIRLHSAPENKEESGSAGSSPKLTLLGHFKVKEEDPTGGTSLKPGSLFFSRGSVTSPKAVTSPAEKSTTSYAAAALNVGDPGVAGSYTTTGKTATATSPKEGTPGKRKFEFSKEKQCSPAVRRPEPNESLKPQPKASPFVPAHKKLKTESVSSTRCSTDASTSRNSNLSCKAPVPEKKLKKKKASKQEPVEFQQILQGTFFVLSGFQNPFRGDLRDKALEMGAKYRPDWTPDSTHLICAFKNTPKYNEVKAKGGKIVRKEWILDCYRKKQRLPDKRYLIDGADASNDESEESEEEEGEEQEEEFIPVSNKTSSQRGVPPSANHKPEKEAISKSSEDEEEKTAMSWEAKQKVAMEDVADQEDYGGSTDEEIEGNIGKCDYDSGEDTEDELRKVQEASRKQQKEVQQEEDDPYGGSTDENTDIDEKEGEEELSIPELPDFFEGKHFFLYGDFSNNERRLLIRYITAFNGILEDYMNDKVNYVITAQEWDDNFEEALNENSSLLFVKPRWVYTCNERQKLIPHQPYLVVPQA